MRIGIDARELLGRPTGVGRYLAGLLHAWRQSLPAGTHRFLLYGPAEPPAGIDDLAGRFADHPLVEIRPVPGRAGTLWEQFRLARAVRRDRLDALFAPGYTAPLAIGVPVVLTVHDVSFAAHPEWFSWREGARRRWFCRQSARRAAVVLTDSEFSRDEICVHLGLAAARVRVVRPGVPARAAPPDAAVAATRDPLVLFAGSIFTRRHVPMLIEAFAEVARACPAARLAVVGENRTRPRQDLAAVAAAAGVSGRVSIMSWVPDSVLAGLYARASVFVFLSAYEGFGLPPLEALQAGVPVILFDTPVAREICGDAALFVRPGDTPKVADAIRTLMADEAAGRRLLARADGVLAQYSWERAARETLAALEDATKESGR